MDLNRLRRQYRELLLDGIVPFWLKHGVDWEHVGVLTCMTNEGALVNNDKYIWSQARSAWFFAALYNRIEKRPEFLDAAWNSVRFLLDHGRDPEGRRVYRTSRDGTVLEGPISVFSDCFAVYGLGEYARAKPGNDLVRLARCSIETVYRDEEAPDFHATAPHKLVPGHRAHSIPMILTEVSNELAQTTGDAALEARADLYAAQVMNKFLRPQRRLLVEFLDRNYEELPAPEGTFVNPGHAIESMWFVMHLALRRGDQDTVRQAAEVIRWHLEAGWDPEYGGIFLGIDADGGQPFQPHSEEKIWWSHTEAFYALLLAARLTGEKWCEQWYDKVHEWSFSKFAMPEIGEWRQRLDRAGNPTGTVVALPVKDPFHLLRTAILAVQLLEGAR